MGIAPIAESSHARAIRRVSLPGGVDVLSSPRSV